MSLPRLFRATFRGEYAGTTRGRLLMVLGAVAYVVSPIDLIPELALSVFGLADDAVVVSWIAATVVNETESFLPGSAPSAGRRGARDRARATSSADRARPSPLGPGVPCSAWLTGRVTPLSRRAGAALSHRSALGGARPQG